MHTDARVFGWALRKRSSGSGDANGSTATAATKPVLRRAMLVHAVLVLFMHSLLVAFFFLDSGLHGAVGLIVGLAATSVAFVLSMWRGISMWDLLRCPWRPRSFVRCITGALDYAMGALAVLAFVALVGFGVWGVFYLLRK